MVGGSWRILVVRAGKLKVLREILSLASPVISAVIML